MHLPAPAPLQGPKGSLLELWLEVASEMQLFTTASRYTSDELKPKCPPILTLPAICVFKDELLEA